MKQVSFIDIANYAYDAGFRGEPHAIVVALAVPESDRVATASNRQDPNGGSFGLLQINGVHDPNASGEYPNRVPTDEWIQSMFDPAENLKAAWRVYKQNGGSFAPWGAFTAGLHVASLDAAKVALDGSARVRYADARTAQFRAERDRIRVLHDKLVADVRLLESKIADAVAALA